MAEFEINDKCLYSNANINESIIHASAKRDIEILKTTEEIRKAIHQEKIENNCAEQNRKSKEEQDARVRVDAVWDDLNSESKCYFKAPSLSKKIALSILVVVEIAVLTYWTVNPIRDANFEELIPLILLVGILLTFILLLGNVIFKEERELAKAKAQIFKEVFMRKLK